MITSNEVGREGASNPMRQLILQDAEVLAGYDKVCALYGYIPSMSHWRAWECAAYENFRLSGRVLDLGCGDGRYFRLIWPDLSDVVGVELDVGVADAAVRSGVYRHVHVVGAHRIPEHDNSFDHVFANCSLEHMDHIDEVLSEIHRCLKPGGTLLCSVVTDRFPQWCSLPALIAAAGHEDTAARLSEAFIGYHHLVNPLPVEDWHTRLGRAGLTPEVHVPILPRINSGAFLFIDSLWHLSNRGSGEMGEVIHPFLRTLPDFARGFRSVVAGLLQMELDRKDCSGAVFLARKPV